MRLKHYLSAAALAGASLGPGAAQAQTPISVDPGAAYTQATSGMRFPASVGDFERVAATRYAADGSDESVGYNRIAPGAEIIATVYVFHSPSILSVGSPNSVVEDTRSTLCARQYAAIKNEVTAAHRDAVLASEGQNVLAQGDLSYADHVAVYDYGSPRFAGRRNVALRSELHVLCYVGGPWTIEYRIDYPREQDLGADVAAFMRALVITIAPESSHHGYVRQSGG